MDVQLIDDYVGHDGQSYFCRGCGRAGFNSVASVRGHLAHCSSKQQQQLPPAKSAHEAKPDVGLSSFSGALGAIDVDNGGNMARMWGTMRKIDERLDRIEKTLYNEIPHQLAVAQVQRQDDGMDKTYKWLLVVLIGLWVLKYLGGDTSKTGNKIGDKVLSKAVDGLFNL